MGDFLATMARASAKRAARLDRRALARAAARARLPRVPAFGPEGFDVVAEVKLRSPTAGALADEDASAMVRRARSYARAGAVAVSVLTEPDRFGGSLADLERIAAATDIPVMRKDFPVDPAQVWEARAAGADGILLIAGLVPRGALDRLADVASECGLFVLVEAFDDDDLGSAIATARRVRDAGGTAWLGINARDLTTLAVDADRHARVAPRLPPEVPAVAESALASTEDVRARAAAGYRAALVGSALMRAPDPGRLLAAMLAAGRASARGTEEDRPCASA